MGKAAYIGVDDLAHKVKKGYIGVEALARKIKKAYVGVGGVARPFWSGGELSYWGTTSFSDTLNGMWWYTAANDDYLFFARQQYSTSTAASLVVALNNYLTLTTSVEALSQTRNLIMTTSAGEYALFGGGQYRPTTTSFIQSAVVDAYGADLTHVIAPEFARRAYMGAATRQGERALFGGGNAYDVGYTSQITIYDASLTRTTQYLSVARQELAAAAVGEYAIFAGGTNTVGSASALVQALDSSNTKVSLDNLSYSNEWLAGISADIYALFGGGHGLYQGSYEEQPLVYAFDSSLTRKMATNLSLARRNLGGTYTEGFAIFGGGINNNAPVTNVDAYDQSLVRTTQHPLSTGGQKENASASLGGYAVFAAPSQDGVIKSDVYVVS